MASGQALAHDKVSQKGRDLVCRLRQQVVWKVGERTTLTAIGTIQHSSSSDRFKKASARLPNTPEDDSRPCG
jgi:hypothetical protein